MREYRYVLAASDGTSCDFARREQFPSQCFDLPDLLAAGWQPVRETPMGQGTWLVDGQPTNYALVLVVLAKKSSSPKLQDRKNNTKSVIPD